MNSSEYHDCMSETLFTRALVWFVVAVVAHEHLSYPLSVVSVIATVMYALFYLTLSYLEHREAE